MDFLQSIKHGLVSTCTFYDECDCLSEPGLKLIHGKRWPRCLWRPVVNIERYLIKKDPCIFPTSDCLNASNFCSSLWRSACRPACHSSISTTKIVVLKKIFARQCCNSNISTRITCPIDNNIDVSVRDCSNSSALAMGLLQSCIKPSIYSLCTYHQLQPCRYRTCSAKSTIVFCIGCPNTFTSPPFHFHEQEMTVFTGSNNEC